MSADLRSMALILGLPWNIPADATYRERLTMRSMCVYQLRRYALGFRSDFPTTAEIIERVRKGGSKAQTSLSAAMYKAPLWAMIKKDIAQ